MIGALCLFALAAVAFFGVGATAGAADISLAISATPLSAPMIIAIENGYFRAQGLTPRPIYVRGGHRAAEMLFSGEADIATSSEVVVMFNAFHRDDFRVLCTFVSSDNDVKILARAGSGITSVADLRHRRIGTIRNASAHFFLTQALQMAGVGRGDATIVGIAPEEAAARLADGSVDAVSVWDPYATQIREIFGDGVVALPHDRAYIETFNAIAAAAFIAREPDRVDAALRALIQAVDFINAAPERAQAIVARTLDQDPRLVRAVWADLNFRVGLDQWLISTLEAEARWAIADGLVERPRIPNFLDVMAADPLDRVRSPSVTLYR